jgi:DNA-directed RNA polymerase specialized sigma subunit
LAELELFGGIESPEKALERQERLRIVQKGISAIGNQKTRIILRLLLQGEKWRTIEKTLHVSPGEISQAKKKLAECVRYSTIRPSIH